MIQRVLILANPVAGGGRARAAVPELVAALAARNILSEAFLTTGSGDARARVAAAVDQPFDAFIAVGGDGTVNEVVCGLPDLERPLGVLAFGTANVLAAELRLPRSPAALADLVASEETGSLAVGIAESEGKTQRFLLFVGAGTDAAIVSRVDEVRTGTLGKMKWIAPTMHIFRRFERFAMRAECSLPGAKDVVHVEGASNVLVTRARNYAGTMRLPKGIDIEGEGMHVVAFRRTGRIGWLRTSMRGVLRSLRPGKDVELHQVERVVLRSCDPNHSVPYQIDGDPGGTLPVTLSLEPRRLRVFRPD